MKRLLVPSMLLALSLAGCGGGGGGSAAPKTTPTSSPSTPSSKTGTVSVTIDWPAVVTQSNPQKRKPQYISFSTQSINVYLNGALATTINNPCTTGPVTVAPGSTRRAPSNATTQSTCTSTTTTITAPQGYNTFGATGYDGMGGMGTALATSVTPTGYTVTAGNNVVTVQMNGIVSAISVTPPGTIQTGSNVFKVFAIDPDGNTITGAAAYANAMTVALSDPFGSFTGAASTTFTAPQNSTTGENDITLTYNGNNDCTAQFVMTAPAVGTLAGAASSSQTLQSPGSGGSVGAWFGRARLCWASLGSGTSYIYRGTTPGGESATALATTGSGSTTYQDYTARAGSTYYYKVCTGPLTTSTCSTEFSGAPSGDVDNYFGATAPTYWYDINDQSTVSGTQVQDKSGNGYTLTLTGMVNTANAINGRNALYSTVPGVYARTSGGSFSPTNGVTVFVVASQTGNAATGSGNYQRLINFGYANDVTGFVGTAPNGAAQGLVASFFGNATGGWYNSTYTGPATTWGASPALYVVQSDGSSTPTYGGTGIGSYSWFNGSAMNNVPQGNFVAATGMDVGAYVSVGNLITNQGWNGYIAEIIVYPLAQGTIGTTQRQKIEGYLACKWGFQGSLPASHPYALGKACP